MLEEAGPQQGTYFSESSRLRIPKTVYHASTIASDQSYDKNWGCEPVSVFLHRLYEDVTKWNDEKQNDMKWKGGWNMWWNEIRKNGKPPRKNPTHSADLEPQSC